jgi:predicted DNA-binding antitoxin AbrB/MazE fold protein
MKSSQVFMSQTLDAVFDGSVFRPDQPIELEPNTRVRITIEPAPTLAQEPESFLRVAQSLNLDGPPDWSSRLDEYLYSGNGTLDE